MSDMSQYRDMLKEIRKKRGTWSEPPSRPLKRRKKRRNLDASSEPPLESSGESGDEKKAKEEVNDVELFGETKRDNSDSDVTEVKPKVYLNDNNQMDLKYESIDNSPLDLIDLTNDSPADSSEDEFNSDEFENVELEPESMELDIGAHESNEITVAVQLLPAPRKKTKKNANVIDREEKAFRKAFHYMVLAMMACHGVVRNHWINDESLQEYLKQSTPRHIVKSVNEFLRCDANVEKSYTEKQIQSRKLLDCLKKLMEFWNDDFIINKDVGLYKKWWNEIDEGEEAKSTSKQRFKNRVMRKRGSRDIAAQGFVLLLRSLGLYARLVFSLQPPDFTNNIKLDVNVSSRSASPLYKPRPRASTKSVKGLRPGERLIQEFRNRKAVNDDIKLGSQSIDNELEYPVFWAEVWDKFSKKWISVDTICFKYIEVVRLTSKFEPPLTDQRNNAYYVLGYDNEGRVRDITRRYARNYNAKIRKKRITREPKGETWYNKLITSLNPIEGRLETGVDIKELEYFLRKSLQEGMPNSIQDFKNHPIYVLEDQLKANEIISPKNPCGRTRKKSSKNSEIIPVYKRENVHIVRSAKAWYMRGRVLKTGERPMLIQTNNKPDKKNSNVRYEDDLFGDDELDDNDDEDNDKRLYAESQTELYIPPLVVDGEVPKNAYGNIDLYVPTMLPSNAIYRESKLAVKAAKSLGVDYADAVVGFDFTKGGATTARTKGIVVAKEYEDAMISLETYLQQEEDERLRKRVELNALRGWKLLLTKLRIRDDLNRKYGNIDGIDEAMEHQFKKVEADFKKLQDDHYDSEDDEDIYGKYYDSTSDEEVEEKDSDEDFGGGFLPQDGQHEPSPPPMRQVSDDESYGGLGGYVMDDDGYLMGNSGYVMDDESGGYVLDDLNAGGFLLDDQVPDNESNAIDDLSGGEFVLNDELPDNEPESVDDLDAGGFLMGDEVPYDNSNEVDDLNGGGFLVGDPNDDKSPSVSGNDNVIEDPLEHNEPIDQPVETHTDRIPIYDVDDEEEFLYDPKLQDALLRESKLESQKPDTVLDQESDVDSIDSLELANEGIDDDDISNEDDALYNDNEFEYSDDD